MRYTVTYYDSGSSYARLINKNIYKDLKENDCRRFNGYTVIIVEASSLEEAKSKAEMLRSTISEG